MIREQENFRELDSEDLAVEEIPFVLQDTGSWKVFNEAELNLQAAAGETSLSECYLLTESNLKYLGPITLENFVEIPEKGSLPEKRREVLLLRYYLGYSDTEIGRLFGVCRSTIFHRRKRALRLLRKEMEALENEE